MTQIDTIPSDIIQDLPLDGDALNSFLQDAIKVARERIRANQVSGISPEFAKYQNDPVGFGETVLGETFTDDVKRVMESVRDFPVTIAKSANGVGKTHAAARIAVWWYKCFPGAQVYTAAAPPEGNLKRLLWGEIDAVTRKAASMFVHDRYTTLNISRNASEFITGVTIPQTGTPEQREARFSGKHAPHLLFIIDEGDAVPDEVYRGIESCMSGGHARLLIMFNPRAKAGPVYRKERDRRANIVEMTAFSHPNVITGQDIIPGAVSRAVVVRRINEFTRPRRPDEPATTDTFAVPDYLVGAVGMSDSGHAYPPLPAGERKVTESAFSYMVLARYPSQSLTQLIDEAWINAARMRWDLYVEKFGEIPPKSVTGVIGLDVAEYGSDTNALCIRYGGLVLPIIEWSKVDPVESGKRLGEAFISNPRITKIYVDGTGVGAGTAPAARNYLRRRKVRVPRGLFHSVKVATSPTQATDLGEFAQIRDQLWWMTREWLRIDPLAMLPPDDMLAEELTAVMYEKNERGKIKVTSKKVLRTRLRRSPNRADSLCLTFAPSKPSFRLDLI